jgi:hypothetical protein
MNKEDLENLKKDEGFYKINICAEHLARSFEQVAETLLHKMAHLYNLQIGVQDTTRGGAYHNKKYKEAAEQHGLTVGKDAKYDWTVTTLNAAKVFRKSPVQPKQSSSPASMFARCTERLSEQRNVHVVQCRIRGRSLNSFFHTQRKE